jgi:rhodanese-related sulfurtransferase
LAQQLEERGYKKVYALEGGFDAWQETGLPVEPKRQAA